MRKRKRSAVGDVIWWAITGALIAAAMIAASVAGAAGLPNVLVVVLDDVRADDVAMVPHVEELAARGAEFTRAVTPFALCTPARATILSGNYPATHGVRSNSIATFDPSSTIATWFDAAGYETGLFGKYGNCMRALTAEPPGWDVFLPFLTHRDHGSAQSAVLGQQVSDFVENAPEPFLAYVAPVLPHGPLPGPTECADTVAPPFVPMPGFDESKLTLVQSIWSRRARRLCGLRQTLTMAFAALDRRGVADRTIVALMSDNGFMLGEHGDTGKNVLFDPAIRVPLVIAGPGVPVGQRTGLASLADVAPTLADLAGVPRPAVDGRSLFATPPPNFVPIESLTCAGKRRRDSKTVTCGEAPTLVYDLLADPWELNPTVQP